MPEVERFAALPSSTFSSTEGERDVLIAILENEWQDHFHTRNQAWKTLDIDAILVVALLGISWQLKNSLATSLAAALLIIAAFFGACITIHHRNVEITKLTHIYHIEEKLGMKGTGILKDIQIPLPIKWYNIFYHKHFSTSSFILSMHYIILLFGVIYLVFSIFMLR